MRRRIVACGLAAGLLTICVYWLWPQSNASVLLVTLDTTRADRLGCYGYSAARTPVLDALAASGVLCPHAYTVAPLTLPAHASLFTGLYPAEHGIRSNGRGRLDDSIPTLAEILRRQGYDTAAFVASFVLDAKFGLDRGFRKYDDDIAEETPGANSGANSGADSSHRERDGQAVVDAALAWLCEQRTRPFFCWVHLFDPHAPYLDHADLFGDEFADHPYDAEIAYVDRQVGRLVDFLKARGLDSNTLVVVVGDHGEGLGEHIERKHGMTLYNATMRVPLIFRQNGRLVPGGRLDGNVSLVDVSPTIIELLRLRDPRQTTGHSLARGLLAGESPASTCYGATDEPFLNNGWSPLRSLTEGEWKYIRTTRPELYDLATDPGERHDLAGSNPGQAKEMESRLAQFESRLVLRPSVEVQLRPHEKRALESLGYLGGPAAAAAAPIAANLPDVKDMLPFEAAIDEAADLVNQGALDVAIGKLRAILPHVPAHGKAHYFLAAALRNQSKFDEATKVLRELLDAKPDAVEGHYGLALVWLAQGRDDDAVIELRKTLEVDPDYAEAHYDLAMIDVRRGQADEALAQFGAVLEIDHCHGAAYVERGALLVSQGRIADAIADFRQALRFSPHSPTLHHNLGIVLVGMGNDDEALPHLARAVELRPDVAEFQYSLGSSLLKSGRFAEAIEHLSKALELKPGYAAAKERLQEARAARK
ncbi:MAG TPA: sulfatase-like hydrolase/transferase [Planctomycetaceae bacterium]